MNILKSFFADRILTVVLNQALASLPIFHFVPLKAVIFTTLSDEKFASSGNTLQHDIAKLYV